MPRMGRCGRRPPERRDPTKDTHLSLKRPYIYQPGRFFPGIPVPGAHSGGFTLVELLIAVSILASGIALVVRSFSLIVSVLDNCDNRVAAVQAMAAKMAETELFEKEEGGVLETEERDTLQLGGREAACISRAVAADEQPEDAADISLLEDTITVSWKEGNKNKDAVLAAYFKQKKSE